MMQIFRARQAGFTLIELMIAVAIAAIAVSLAVPNFLRWYNESQLRQATSEIANKLTLARLAGMTQNRGVNVTVQNVGAVVQISAVASSGTSVFTNTNESFPPRVKSIVGSPVTVSFSSLGLRTSAGTGVQTIGVCDAYGNQYSVTIIPTGKVNWSVNPIQPPTPCP